MSEAQIRLAERMIGRLQRRQWLKRSLGMVAFYTVPGAFAEALTVTPQQTEGPFYPDKLPLDTDNDLIRINDGITPAVGEVTWFTGTVQDVRGNPVKGAVVEIWQCDASGVYIHSKSGGPKAERDANFQGFGRFLTGSKGEYGFRTIKPVAYGRRTPHIHVKVKVGEEELLTTQCYIEGEPLNLKDGIWNRTGDARAKAAVTVPFVPLPGSSAGELSAQFNIVLGRTPGDGRGAP